MIQLIPIAIGASIGYLLKEDSKPEVQVVTQYVQSNNYNYTQNNYNVNVNYRSYKKKNSYRISYNKAKFVISNNAGQFLTDGGQWVYDSDYAKRFSIGDVKYCTRKLRQLGYKCRYDRI